MDELRGTQTGAYRRCGLYLLRDPGTHHRGGEGSVVRLSLLP